MVDILCVYGNMVMLVWGEVWHHPRRLDESLSDATVVTFVLFKYNIYCGDVNPPCYELQGKYVWGIDRIYAT